MRITSAFGADDTSTRFVVDHTDGTLGVDQRDDSNIIWLDRADVTALKEALVQLADVDVS